MASNKYGFTLLYYESLFLSTQMGSVRLVNKILNFYLFIYFFTDNDLYKLFYRKREKNISNFLNSHFFEESFK